MLNIMLIDIMMLQYKYKIYWLAKFTDLVFFLLKSDVLACCNTDNKEDRAFLDLESIASCCTAAISIPCFAH